MAPRRSMRAGGDGAADNGGGEIDDDRPRQPRHGSIRASSTHSVMVPSRTRNGMGSPLATADRVDRRARHAAATLGRAPDAVEFPRAQRPRVSRQDGRRLRRPALHLRRVRGAGQPAGLGAAGGRAGSRATASPSSARTSRRCWKRTSRCRSPAASSSRSTPAWRRTTSPASSNTPAPAFLLVDTELSPLGCASSRPASRPAPRSSTSSTRDQLRPCPGRPTRSSWPGDNRIANTGDWRARTT